MEVTGSQVAAFLGRSGDATFTAPAAYAAQTITMMARAYTRGNGFVDDEPNDEIEAVIVCAAARLAANTSQLSHSHTAGVFTETFNNGFQGWTLAETMVLNRYRKRAQ